MMKTVVKISLLPAELGGGGNAGLQQEWCRVYSPPDQKYYYYSNWSHDITWDPPINFIPPPKGVPQKMLVLNCFRYIIDTRISTSHIFRHSLVPPLF